MSLQAGNPFGPHERVVARPRRQVESIAHGKVERLGRGRESEPDRAPFDNDDLVVGMIVRSISLARAVRPAGWTQPLVAQPAGEIVRHGYATTEVPIHDPIRYVTTAAARPIPS